MDPAPNSWLYRPRRVPHAALRLICFPYAGAGASVFRTWPDALPGNVEVIAIAPPGREGRSRERSIDQLPAMVAALTDAIATELEPPFAIYGHSLGALVGFAFARELRRRGRPQPVHLFVSGRRAPQIPDAEALHELPDRELTAWMRRLGGVPDAVLQEAELMAYFLPIVRADLALNSSAVDHDLPLDSPITAMRGAVDERVTLAQLTAWQAQTRGAFAHEVFPGGHFFIQSDRAAFLADLSRRLSQLTSAQ